MADEQDEGRETAPGPIDEERDEGMDEDAGQQPRDEERESPDEG